MEIWLEERTGADKSFSLSIDDILFAQIDYDDVNHPEVDAATRHLEEIIKEHWNSDKVKEYYKEELLKAWDNNEYNIQDDYDNVEDYLSQHIH